MFAPHTAQIEIERNEPENLDLEKAIKKVHARNYSVAYAAFYKGKLKARKNSVEEARKRILKAWETDARLISVTPFFDSWNRWRNYYRPADHGYEINWRPTHAGAVSCAERITQEVNSMGLDLDLVIAAGHKAFTNARAPLKLTFFVAHWQELYERYADEVKVDIDEDEYKVSSADEWDAETL